MSEPRRGQALRALSGVLLVLTAMRAATDAPGSWLKFGSIDIFVAVIAAAAFATTLHPERGSVAAWLLNRTPLRRWVGIAAFAAVVLAIVRLVLSALGVGVPQHVSDAGSLADVLVVLAQAAALLCVGLLVRDGRPLLQGDASAWSDRAAGHWERLRQRYPAPTAWALAGLFAAGAFVSFFRIGTPSLVIDELFYRTAGLAYIAHGDFTLNREHTFLAKDLFGAVQMVFGSGVTAFRAPAALAALLTGVVLFSFGRRVAGVIAGAAAFAAWTLLPHPIYADFGNIAVISIGRYGLLDPVMVLFLVLALAFGWRWIQTGAWRWALWCGIAGGLSVGSKFTAACVLPGLVVCGLVMCSDRRKAAWQAGAIVIAVVLVVLVSYLPPLGNSPASFSDLLHFQQLHSNLGQPVLIGGHVYSRAPWWALLWWEWHSVGPVTTVVLVACAIAACFFIGWRLSVYLWVAILVPLVYLSLFVGFALPHYYLIWQAPLALLAALGVASLWRAGRLLRVAGALLAIPLVVATAITIGDVATLRPNDYAAAGQLLERDGLAQGRVAVWFAPALLAAYVPHAQLTTRPPRGGFVDAIVVDPNYSRTIPNRVLQGDLFLGRSNFVACRVSRLTVYVRVRPAAARRATHIC